MFDEHIFDTLKAAQKFARRYRPDDYAIEPDGARWVVFVVKGAVQL